MSLISSPESKSQKPSAYIHTPATICIAGTLPDTVNYQKALASVGLSWDAICPSSLSAAQACLALSEKDYAHLEQYAGLLLPGGGDLPCCLPGGGDLPCCLPGGGDLPCCLSGGGDLPCCLSGALSPFDLWQLALLHFFIIRKKPILGICKGMQLINLYFHGTLYPDLSCAAAHCWDTAAQKDQMHATFTLPDTCLHRIYGNAFQTNSAHHQGCARLGSGLLPAQYSDDCVIEAFYHVSLPVMGLQWHPERMSSAFHTPDMIDGSEIFSYFKSLCILSKS